MSGWIDITTPLRSGMAHWPGDPDIEIGAYQSIGADSEYNATRMSMSVHTGTHVDAPRHYLVNGIAVDEMPFEAMTGAARVIAADAIESIRVARGDRILIKSAGGSLTPAQARCLANSGILLAGIDSLSIGGSGDECGEVHRILLSAGVWIVEGLILDQVEPGPCEVLCLPLRLIGADGAPARALLRRR